MDEKVVCKLQEHSKRLNTIRNSLNFYLYCVENQICYNNNAELSSMGQVIKEYYATTKSKFNDLETELGIVE